MPLQMSIPGVARLPPMPPNHTVVQTGEQIEEAVRHCLASPLNLLDYETNGVDWFRPGHPVHAIGVGVGTLDRWGQVRCWYMPMRHQTGEPQLDVDAVLRATQEILAAPTTKSAWHLKFEHHITRNEGLVMGGRCRDVMIDAQLYNENVPLGIDDRVRFDLGKDEESRWEAPIRARLHRLAKAREMGFEEYLGAYGYSELPIAELGPYACWDLEWLGRLQHFYDSAGVASRYPGVWSTEQELVGVLVDMERAGLPLDVEYIQRLREKLVVELETLLGRLTDLLGPHSFDPAKDAQLRNYLFGVCGYPILKVTPSNAPAVDADVLRRLAESNPACALILEYRDAAKIKSTYTDSLLARMDAHQVCHTDFRQLGAGTGRMASAHPNFQNIVGDDDERAMKATGLRVEDGGVDPWSVKRAFIVATRAEHERTFRMMADFEQIELKVMTHYSRDPILWETYMTGGDVHKRTALEVFGEYNKPVRRRAKVLNFGLAYGMSEYGFAKQAGLPVEEARAYLAKFYSRYAGIASFKEYLYGQVRLNPRQEFCNLYGRPRRVPAIISGDRKRARRGERMVISSSIQGTAADLVKRKLVRVHRVLREVAPTAMLCNVIHDDLHIDMDVGDMRTAVPRVIEAMEDCPEFAPIPITVGTDYSFTSWADKRPLPRA